MRRALIVVDMQNDFVTGALGSEEGKKIVKPVENKIREAIADGADVIFTQDTHGEDYMETQEGRKLPVPHCVKGTEGWKIIPELESYAAESPCVEKPSFGSMELAQMAEKKGYQKICLIGLCTDICVISNAMLLKAALPEAVVEVDEKCCAGVTVESHKNALEAMKACQIDII